VPGMARSLISRSARTGAGVGSCLALALTAGLLGSTLVNAPATSAPAAEPRMQRVSDTLAASAEAGGYPVGRPRIRSLALDEEERTAFARAGYTNGVRGVSLKGGVIEFSPDALREARSAWQGGGIRSPSFQLVKLVLHEQLHQVTWSGRERWFDLESPERVLDEGVTEALAWDLARVWCHRAGTECVGERGVVDAYRQPVARIRWLAMRAGGTRRFTARPAKAWMRSYLRADESHRVAMRVAAARAGRP
jgi:hypothetical protein